LGDEAPLIAHAASEQANAVLRHWSSGIDWALSHANAHLVGYLLAIRHAARGRMPADILKIVITLVNSEAYDV
jgi:hypothetical protein